MAAAGETTGSEIGRLSGLLISAVVAAIALIGLLLAIFAAVNTKSVLIAVVIAAVSGLAILWGWQRRSLDSDMTSAKTGGSGLNDDSVAWPDLVTALPDPAIVLNRSSTILNFNPAALALFDRLRIGLSLEHVNRDPGLIDAVAGALENGEKRTVRLVPRSGPRRHLLATVAPLGSGALPREAALITIRDLSEQHRLLEMRSDFIANASHELRTPLASVRGFIETLQGPARNDEAARTRFLSIMADQAERMTRLIDDLLLLSRVEEKANLKPTGRVRLDEVIDEVVRSIQPIASDRGITVTFATTPTTLHVSGDRDELFQVFQNLVENAVKYGRDGGTVEIVPALDAVANDSAFTFRVVTTIKDDGPGIAPEHLPRLTERFYRVNADQSRKVGGTGLGLAIVKHVLNRHHGELHVESIVGSGTSFRVVLPAFKA